MSMRQTILAGIAILAFASLTVTLEGRPARAADAKASSITIDFFAAGGMQVTFRDDLQPQVRADFLKSELENYVHLFKPPADYLATPYDAAGKSLGGAMIYVHDRDKVIPLDLYQQGR